MNAVCKDGSGMHLRICKPKAKSQLGHLDVRIQRQETEHLSLCY